jgi:hypothetical protein
LLTITRLSSRGALEVLARAMDPAPEDARQDAHHHQEGTAQVEPRLAGGRGADQRRDPGQGHVGERGPERGHEPAGQALVQTAGDHHQREEHHELALAPAGLGRQHRHQRQVEGELQVDLDHLAAPQQGAQPVEGGQHPDRDQRPPQHPPRLVRRARGKQHPDRQRQGGHQKTRANQRLQALPAVADVRQRGVERGGIGLRGLLRGRLRAHPFPPATTLISLNIGRYMATTMPPTMPPITTIITGSMIEVMVSTAVSTSAS